MIGDAGSEEKGPGLEIGSTHDLLRARVRFVMKSDRASESFVGPVENVMEKPPAAVRVEMHLSGGTELGPTPREDLQPGQKRPVTLSAAGKMLKMRKAHVESGERREHAHGREVEEEPGNERDGERGKVGRTPPMRTRRYTEWRPRCRCSRRSRKLPTRVGFGACTVRSRDSGTDGRASHGADCDNGCGPQARGESRAGKTKQPRFYCHRAGVLLDPGKKPPLARTVKSMTSLHPLASQGIWISQATPSVA